MVNCWPLVFMLTGEENYTVRDEEGVAWFGSVSSKNASTLTVEVVGIRLACLSKLQAREFAQEVQREVYIATMIRKRSIAKANKDFSTADCIRSDLLKDYGVLLEDSVSGTSWKRA